MLCGGGAVARLGTGSGSGGGAMVGGTGVGCVCPGMSPVSDMRHVINAEMTASG
eukprot:CAMPEP_0119090890 /NCGR_PEP_ID=MMETSP1178-20130426/154411_1 /TAXON_ID=33656 /ORGANISM="unid sp, Strain CCMP2000" /LENGTH=53 /DNA_ID=CAMNT_0007074351 /DNA_START=21 /DNA_END=178 /DNA_ORIENTATION=-